MDTTAPAIIRSLLLVFMAVAPATLAQETNVTLVPHRRESTTAGVGTGPGWGPASGGFQMSLRFATNAFASGAPIEATLITKNTTTNALTLWGPQDAYVGFIGADTQGKPLVPLPRKLQISGGTALRLAAGAQVTNSLRLDKLADLKAPGTYHIRARRPIQPLGGSMAEVSSGEATLRIVPEGTGH